MFTCPTVYADSALTSSFVKKDFDFTTNTYILKVGDRIGVEYLGTSSSNYVEMCYVDDIPDNGTSQFQYEGSSWDIKDTREPCLEGYI